MARRSRDVPQEPGYVPYQPTEARVTHRLAENGEIIAFTDDEYGVRKCIYPFVFAWSSYAKERKSEKLRIARNLPRPVEELDRNLPGPVNATGGVR